METKDVLKKLRNDKGETLSALSKQVGISQPTLSRYESGDRKPKYEQLIKLADYYGVSVPYLQGATDIKENPEHFSQNPKFVALQKKIQAEEPLSEEEQTLAAKFYMSARLMTAIDKLNQVSNIVDSSNKDVALKFSNSKLAEMGLNTIDWIIQLILHTEDETVRDGKKQSNAEIEQFMSDIQNISVGLLYGNQDKVFSISNKDNE
ncbi:helix-turn-helix domain-containing protein [Weissella confusa]|uniref:helix-turn-helix domain-containing protein n=1 Tax=Weissella confusa TaxID=1583 RepID=UPI00222490EF|nr:helix-turn-helix transcriptional regulator [Weissella confusa]UYY90714.1 helix-turn-helix transcriptional regulator [Weissella confusa]